MSRKIKARKPPNYKFSKPPDINLFGATLVTNGIIQAQNSTLTHAAIMQMMEEYKRRFHLPKRKYVVIKLEFLEDNEQLYRELRWLLETHGGTLAMNFARRELIVVDDKVPEEILDAIKNLLDGYPTEIRELPIIEAPQGGWKPSQGRGTFGITGRDPSVRSMRRKP